MGLGLTICMVLYIYLVVASIAHVAARQSLETQIASQKATVAALETSYLAKTTSITEEYAHTLGFVTPQQKTFVERSSLSLKNAP